MIRAFPKHDFSTVGTFVFPAGSASEMWNAYVAMHKYNILHLYYCVSRGEWFNLIILPELHFLHRLAGLIDIMVSWQLKHLYQ